MTTDRVARLRRSLRPSTGSGSYESLTRVLRRVRCVDSGTGVSPVSNVHPHPTKPTVTVLRDCGMGTTGFQPVNPPKADVKPHRLSKSLPAFTLTELLITTSIITLLITLLIPALHRAKSTSQRAVCASNLRQITLANLTYANNHRSHLAPGASDFLQNLNRWFGTRRSIYEPFEPKNGPLSPYLDKTGTIRRCPTFKPDNETPGTAFEAGCGGYGYSNTYLGVTRDERDTAGINLSAINIPTQTIMFTDTAFAQSYPNPHLIEYSFTEPPYQRNNPEQPLDPSIHFRHNGSATIAWSDAHIDSRPLKFTKGNIFGLTEKQMKVLNLGWPGPQNNHWFDLN